MSEKVQYEDVQVRIPLEAVQEIAKLASQCGLSIDQMASAMFALSCRHLGSEEATQGPTP